MEVKVLSQEDFTSGKVAGESSAWTSEIVTEVKDAMNSHKGEIIAFAVAELLEGYKGSVQNPRSKQARLLVKQCYLNLSGEDKLPKQTLKVDNTLGLIKIKVFD
jgi:hypothetical protein